MTRNLVTGQVHSVVNKNEPFYKFVLFLVIGLGRGKNKMQMESDFVRRSSRRQKVRGEREFIVNSDMMLRDFKVKVNIKCYVMAKPFDCYFLVDGDFQSGTI